MSLTHPRLKGIEYNYYEDYLEFDSVIKTRIVMESDPGISQIGKPRIKTRKVNRPSKEALEILIKDYPFVKIGKDYNVSDNAVRKWCKSYGLPYKLKDIKSWV